MATQRINIDNKSKNILTLLQETIGVFFDGDRGPVYRNPSPAPPTPSIDGKGQNSNYFNRYFEKTY